MDNIHSLKFIDRIIGRSLCSLFPRPRFFDRGPVRKILIIRPGGIGDAVLLSSVISCLKKTTDYLHITILAERRNAGVFPLIPSVDEVFCYDRPLEFIKTLRSRYDVVIDTEQWHRLSAVVAGLIRAPIKIGFDTNERRRMFTHGILYDLCAYEPDNFFALLQPLGAYIQKDVGTITLSLTPAAVIRASQLLKPLSSDPFVVIFPGASIPEKRWGAERFRVVSKWLSEDGYRIVVVGGMEDREDGDVIVGTGGLNLAGMTTLAETAAVIARSRLLISGDSGVLHLAVGLDIPTVSLFGPGIAKKWAPKGEKHVVLNRNLLCSPCTYFGTTPPCPYGVRCMKEITADQVMMAAVSLLQLETESRNQNPSRIARLSPQTSEIKLQS